MGLESGDKVPDEKTVWLFRENLTNAGLVEKIFEQFTQFLEHKGLIMNEGKMIDASFTVAPRQRNTREENNTRKEGKGDELWSDEPNKKRPKDINARWTKKITKISMAIKTIQKLTLRANSLINMQLLMHQFMIHNHWTIY